MMTAKEALKVTKKTLENDEHLEQFFEGLDRKIQRAAERGESQVEWNLLQRNWGSVPVNVPSKYHEIIKARLEKHGYYVCDDYVSWGNADLEEPDTYE